MSKRNVSFVGKSGQPQGHFAALINIPQKWRNYALVVWSQKDMTMLQMELEEAWEGENYMRFKSLPYRHSDIPELMRRKVGTTIWSDEAILAQGVKVIRRGPPYKSRRWHFLWPDHQTFVEELSERIINTPGPSIEPLRLLVYKASGVLNGWDKKGPPMAVTFEEEDDDALSDQFTGGKEMLRAYPGGPNRIRRS